MDAHVTKARRDAYTASDSGAYALSAKIMLTSIIVLFFVIIALFAFHIYARWYLIRSRRRHLRARHANNIFHVNAAAAANAGLDSHVLDSLPIFTFSSKTYPDSVPECAVCLSEFEENESGRILPKCNHIFHIDCIDMWFQSHSTCPLCRTTVEGYDGDNFGDAGLRVPDPIVAVSASGADLQSFTVCENGDPVGTSSSGSPWKLKIDVPMRRGQNFEGDSSGLDSGTSQSFRSPLTRMLSFRRMLSRERRQTPCASPGNAGNWGPDLERGAEENRLTQ